MEAINLKRKTMKKLLYILSFIPLSVCAQVGIGTDEPTALLEIKSDPTGIPALALTPQETPKGSATGQMAVIDNILYLFDEDRNKWLSVEHTMLEFGRLGSGSDPAEVEFGGGDLQNGPRMPFEGTIVGITLSATEDDNNRDVTLFINKVAVPNNDGDQKIDGVFNLDPTTLIYNDPNYNVDFNKGDMLSFAIDSGVNDIEELIISLKVKWRKDNP